MSALMNEEKVVFEIIFNLEKIESTKNNLKYKISAYVLRPSLIIYISVILYLYSMPLYVLKDLKISFQIMINILI